MAGRASALRNYFEPLERFEAIDRYTLELKYREKLFTNMPMLLDLEPLPRWLYMYDEDGHRFDDATWGVKFNEHWYNRMAIGVGPYRFVKWEAGVRFELERNERYWGEPPAFDRVLMPIVNDQNAWVRKLAPPV